MRPLPRPVMGTVWWKEHWRSKSRILLDGGDMVCTACGGVRFVPTDYKTSEASAPTFECVECHALARGECAANSEKARESIVRPTVHDRIR